MFDISLGELTVIGAVALVVIGPEKLPKVARTAGMLFGRAQRMVASVKADLDRELRNAELAQLQAEVDKEAAAIKDEFSIPAQEVWHEAPAAPAEPVEAAETQPVLPEAPKARADVDERQLDLFAEPESAPVDNGRDRR